MMIDLQKIKEVLSKPKNIAIGAGVLVVLAILVSAAVSVFLSPATTADDVPIETPLPPTATPPVATPRPTAVIALEPAPPSVHTVVWTNRETGIYLRKGPGDAAILTAIPNGEEIHFGTQMVEYGGVRWVETSYGDHYGWVADRYVFNITGETLRIGSDGAWLFKDQDGIVQRYLWAGSPFQVLQEVYPEEGAGFIWLEIRLPDSSSGWIKWYG